jgi:hypothetical protein
MKHWTMRACVGLAALMAAPMAVADENVKLEDLPTAVRQTIQREVKNGKITDIERQKDGNTIYYEVEYTAGNKDYELDIAPDGKLLRREND